MQQPGGAATPPEPVICASTTYTTEFSALQGLLYPFFPLSAREWGNNRAFSVAFRKMLCMVAHTQHFLFLRRGDPLEQSRSSGDPVLRIQGAAGGKGGADHPAKECDTKEVSI